MGAPVCVIVVYVSIEGGSCEPVLGVHLLRVSLVRIRRRYADGSEGLASTQTVLGLRKIFGSGAVSMEVEAMVVELGCRGVGEQSPGSEEASWR